MEGLACLPQTSPSSRDKGGYVPVPSLTPCHDGTSNLKAVLLVAKASCKAVLPQGQLCCWGQGGVFL